MQQTTSQPAPGQAAAGQQYYFTALSALGVLYFMMGFITCLNDTLVPLFRQSYRLTYAEAALVQFYFFLTYGLVSAVAGKMVTRLGYKQGMVSGFAIAAIGAALFIPASYWHQYALFLSALFILAIGIVLLQVAANPYITVLGRPETAAARLTLIQGIGAAGTTLAPLFGAAVILHEHREGAAAVAPLRTAYAGIALLLVLIAVVVWRLRLPAFDTGAGKTAAVRLKNLLQFRNLRLGAPAIFAYVGAEVAIGSFLTNYAADLLFASEKAVGHYVSFYWGGMLAGRLLGALVLNRVKPRHVLCAAAACAMLLIGCSVNSSGQQAVWLMVAVGLCNAVMFSVIFSLAVEGMGAYTGRASGILSTAIAGGAVISLLMGFLRDHASWAAAFMAPVACYGYILYYGLNGYRPLPLRGE